MSPEQRVRQTYDRVCDLLDTYQPASVATERLFFKHNETTALGVSRVIGVILLAVAQRDLPWREYTPAEVKQAVVGTGSADKKQVQFMVARLLGLDQAPTPDDAADAAAVAICHAHQAWLPGTGRVPR